MHTCYISLYTVYTISRLFLLKLLIFNVCTNARGNIVILLVDYHNVNLIAQQQRRLAINKIIDTNNKRICCCVILQPWIFIGCCVQCDYVSPLAILHDSLFDNDK